MPVMPNGAVIRVELAWPLDATPRRGYGRDMSRPSHAWERETDEEPVSREAAVVAPAPAPVGSLAWASAVGNQAVQRLARRTVAREAVEEEEEDAEVEESIPEPEGPEAAVEEAPAPPEGFAPEEAAGLSALDDLPEDELPE